MKPPPPSAGAAPRRPKRQPPGLVVLYEDRDIVVVDKAPGLLTVGTDREKERTAYWRMTDWVRKGQARSRERVFVVHRLDREASGIVVFARHFAAKEALQSGWDAVKKTYLAAVHGVPAKRAGTIVSYLAENAAHQVYETQDAARGKLSRTAYRTIGEGSGRALLEIDLLTGRKHQIRVHLAGIGHPIVGDSRYGAAGDRHPRLALHAVRIAFAHPVTGAPLAIEAATPPYFARLLG